MRYLILFLVLFLAACAGSGGVEFSNTGSQGLTVEFLEGFPEDEVYEESPLPISLLVQNRGTWNVSPDRLLMSWSYDPLYIATSDDEVFYPLQNELMGRSYFYPEGDYFNVEEFGFLTNKVIGQRESPETDLHALVCYEYATRWVEGVCLDVDSYLRTGREQVCTGGEYRTGTQGGPVAFTSVEVRVRPDQTSSGFPAVKPEIIATLRNVGGGTVLAPPLQDFEAACRLDVDSTVLNGVTVSGLLQGYELFCQPAVAKFRNGEARVRCTFTEDSFPERARDLTLPQPSPWFDPQCLEINKDSTLMERVNCLDMSLVDPDCLGDLNDLSPLEQMGCLDLALTPPALWPGIATTTNENPLNMYTSNILTVLALEARYIYRESATKELSILRNNFDDGQALIGRAPPKKGYVYQQNCNDEGRCSYDILINPQTGDPVTKCEQYSQNQSAAPDRMIDLNPEFSCGCSRNECVEMDDFGFCAHGLCPGTFECCDKDAYESFKKASAARDDGE